MRCFRAIQRRLNSRSFFVNPSEFLFDICPILHGSLLEITRFDCDLFLAVSLSNLCRFPDWTHWIVFDHNTGSGYHSCVSKLLRVFLDLPAQYSFCRVAARLFHNTRSGRIIRTFVHASLFLHQFAYDFPSVWMQHLTFHWWSFSCDCKSRITLWNLLLR
jgi:hypothetical protein